MFKRITVVFAVFFLTFSVKAKIQDLSGTHSLESIVQSMRTVEINPVLFNGLPIGSRRDGHFIHIAAKVCSMIKADMVIDFEKTGHNQGYGKFLNAYVSENGSTGYFVPHRPAGASVLKSVKCGFFD